MKKLVPILLTVCFVVQFSLAQEQARLNVTPLDSNITCDKATFIPHSFQNEFLVDSFANKQVDMGGYFQQFGYYTFTATAKSGKINTKSDDYITIGLDNPNTCGSGILASFKGKNIYLPFQGLTIGNKYIIKIGNYYTKTFKVSVIANKKDDNALNEPTNLNDINPYFFNTTDYTSGRYLYYNNCPTTKADSNVINLFIKFKATSSTTTLNLNLDNASLESTLGIMSGDYVSVCKPIQKNKNLRTDEFTGLTIGNDYTVRIEIGGDAALGYARTETANNASITLVGGTVTGVENNSQPIFSIAPNPSNGSFTFVSDKSADLVISDLLGSEIANLQNVTPNQNIELPLPKGIYLLKVSNDKGSEIEKLVIE